MLRTVKNWQQILDEERMREASRRHRRKQGTTSRERLGGMLVLVILAAFVFAMLWQASGRGPIF